MNLSLRRTSFLATGLVAAATALLPLGDIARAEPPAPDVPPAIDVPAGHKVFLVGHAVGVQVYTCNTAGDASPGASSAHERSCTTTTASSSPPTPAARHGRRTTAAPSSPRSHAPAPVDPTAIAWLLLQATITASGPDGDELTSTTFIQRTATTGGLAPPTAQCNSSTVGTRPKSLHR